MPCARRDKQSGLNVVGILGEHQALDVRPQRKVDRIRPVRRLLDDEPDDVEVVMLVFNLEVAQPAHRRRASVGSDLKWFRAMADTMYAHDRALFLDEFGSLGPHPAPKTADGGGLLHQRL